MKDTHVEPEDGTSLNNVLELLPLGLLGLLYVVHLRVYVGGRNVELLRDSVRGGVVGEQQLANPGFPLR